MASLSFNDWQSYALNHKGCDRKHKTSKVAKLCFKSHLVHRLSLIFVTHS